MIEAPLGEYACVDDRRDRAFRFAHKTHTEITAILVKRFLAVATEDAFALRVRLSGLSRARQLILIEAIDRILGKIRAP